MKGRTMSIIQEETLYGSFAGHEEHLAQVVHAAIYQALIDLGDEIYMLDWANVSTGAQAETAEAA
jgi:hypothetical protein